MTNRPSKTRFNPRPRSASLATPAALTRQIAVRQVPPAPAWMLKPLRPPMVKR
jgi:hypothetical protein